MSSLQFVGRTNPVTGQSEWATVPEDYDYQQEIACSGYGDMLHDDARNRAYYDGLRAAIGRLRADGQPVRVLDIGTGSGLLSMMAARLGAEHITACEAFEPVAKCAAEVLSANGLSGRVNLVRKRSTELTVGADGDLQQRATLIVAELFDTELIGECALQSFAHAAANLLAPGGLVVPTGASVWCQVFASDWLASHHAVGGDGDCSGVDWPEEMAACRGLPAPLELQASELQPGVDFALLSAPTPVATFNFADAQRLSGDVLGGSSQQAVDWLPAAAAGTVAAGCFFWWRLTMSPGGRQLSTAPRWHSGGQYDWREHWMQAAFYFPSPVRLPAARPSGWLLHHSHDAYANYFDLTPPGGRPVPSERRCCDCRLHLAASGSRLAELQSRELNSAAASWLPKLLPTAGSVVCVGDVSTLPLLCRRAAPQLAVSSVELTDRGHAAMAAVARTAGVQVLRCLPPVPPGERHVLLSEPHFSSSTLPWDDLRLWHLCSDRLGEWAAVYPNVCRVLAQPVEFAQLHKLRAPVGTCCGFDLSHFDRLVAGGATAAWPALEAQQLWEYPGRLVAEQQTLFDLRLEEFAKAKAAGRPLESELSFRLDGGPANGVALWCEWLADTGQSGTPLTLMLSGRTADGRWNRHRSQAALLLLGNTWPGAGQRLRLRASFDLRAANLALQAEADE